MNTRIMQAIAVAKALEVYARTGHKVNTSYTPGNMMKVAKELTGQEFQPREYTRAASALRTWATNEHNRL